MPSEEMGGKVSEDFFNRGFCLPSGTAMKNADLDRIISIIRNCHPQITQSKT
jgi:dTDP-4-amino-4,6-dideoxygalactose transaminase